MSGSLVPGQPSLTYSVQQIQQMVMVTNQENFQYPSDPVKSVTVVGTPTDSNGTETAQLDQVFFSNPQNSNYTTVTINDSTGTLTYTTQGDSVHGSW